MASATRVSRLTDNLPHDDLALLDPYLEHVTLQQGQVLTQPGEPVGHVVFPGRPTVIALFKQMEDGRLLKVAGLDGASAVGLIELAGDGLAITRAVTIMPGPALRLPTDALRAMLPRSAALRSLVARHNEALVAQVMQNAACNALHTIEKRIARWLLAAHDVARRADDPGPEDRIPLPLTQDMLSDVVGSQRTTVTVIAAGLKDAGIINYGKGRIFVLDRPRLELAACHCNEVVAALYDRLLSAENIMPD